ncbi:DUF4199 domain-containing protein [Adhaeribacter radiodurans]|uniref:DUF4199 domain-containing protein n=1 Tax=Adhaeribacter radiodurans TaxID=2745197 RepID=A0A7L7LBY7_9BACT|nr:DUF4199 domain-containing protein [Adhaeribacter radiodurans]QMU30358.1 DUF4199 domain-containing protein [Adhaeribacter radiodurans]
MLEQAVLRTAVRFGVLAAGASFLVILIVYLTGNNPYGQNAFYALFLLPVFLFTGTAYYKRKFNSDLRFFKGLKLAWLTSFIAAITFGLLIYAFSLIVGAEALQGHIQEMKTMMEQNKSHFLNLPNGKQVYALNYTKLDQITVKSLVLDNFLKLLLVGFLFSLVSATFYRK